MLASLLVVTAVPLRGADETLDYFKIPAYKILTPPKSWYDLTPVYKEPQLLLYTQEFTYTCSQCHEGDLKTKPKKSHLPFGAHEDMFFTHGLNLRCLNCHNANNPDAYADHDGSVIPKDQPVLLCRKCHGVTYRDWHAGVHGRMNGYWNAELGPRKNLACNQCHNPHHPKFPALKPMAPPAAAAGNTHHEEVPHE